MIKPKIVLLIFVSGKCVLTGAKVKLLNLGLWRYKLSIFKYLPCINGMSKIRIYKN